MRVRRRPRPRRRAPQSHRRCLESAAQQSAWAGKQALRRITPRDVMPGAPLLKCGHAGLRPGAARRLGCAPSSTSRRVDGGLQPERQKGEGKAQPISGEGTTLPDVGPTKHFQSTCQCLPAAEGRVIGQRASLAAGAE